MTKVPREIPRSVLLAASLARLKLTLRFRRAAPPLVVAAICVLIPGLAYACIPPPQTFQVNRSTGFTEPIIVSGNADADDDTTRPYGSVFFTDKYCSVTLTAGMPPGLAAFFNVRGTDSSDSDFGIESFKAETSPIPLFNTSDKKVSRSFIVPLRHKITEFYLSTVSNPEDPDYAVRLKGGITITAVATMCSGALMKSRSSSSREVVAAV